MVDSISAISEGNSTVSVNKISSSKDNSDCVPVPNTQLDGHAINEKQSEQEMEESEISDPDANISRPNHPYKVLIAKAILNSQERKLVLADIIDYIAQNYSYYKMNDSSWKNSIRHSLSLNDCFIKVGRSNRGKSNYWSIHPLVIKDFKEGNFHKRHPKQRLSPRSRTLLHPTYKDLPITGMEVPHSNRVPHSSLMCKAPIIPENPLPSHRFAGSASTPGYRFVPSIDNICSYRTYPIPPAQFNHLAVKNFIPNEHDNFYVANSSNSNVGYHPHTQQPLLKASNDSYLRDRQIATTTIMSSSVSSSYYNYCCANNGYSPHHIS